MRRSLLNIFVGAFLSKILNGFWKRMKYETTEMIVKGVLKHV